MFVWPYDLSISYPKMSTQDSVLFLTSMHICDFHPYCIFALRVKRYLGDNLTTLQFRLPTLLWFVDFESGLNFWLDAVATVGLVLSLTVIVSGACVRVSRVCVLSTSISLGTSSIPVVVKPSASQAHVLLCRDG